MSATILQFTESHAETYPQLLTFDSDGEALDPITPDAALWDRLEEYIAHRWTPRSCEWIVNGPGEWRSHLKPVSDVTVEVWGDALVWLPVDGEPSPLGLRLLNNRTYRITATAGDTVVPVPPAVVQAYQRLAEYCADMAGAPAGSSSHSFKLGELSEEVQRAPTWLARAIQYSGAADLLRSYRRV